MIASCTLAYLIKFYYFDVVDDYEQTKLLHRGGVARVEHALQAFADGSGARWRASVWIASHVALVVAVVAEGDALKGLLLPWDGYPLSDIYTVLRARYLIVTPLTVILWALCLQQSMHRGAGHGRRIIGRSKRLAMRGLTGALLLLLPLLIYTADYGEHEALHDTTYSCGRHSPPLAPPAPAPPRAAAPSLGATGDAIIPPLAALEPTEIEIALNHVPAWAYFPHPGSRLVFILLTFLLLLLQLSVEVYGRNLFSDETSVRSRPGSRPRSARPPSQGANQSGGAGTEMVEVVGDEK